MSSLSDYAETLLANFLANTQTATRPTSWYLALFTAAPSDAGGGTELSGSGYARQAAVKVVPGRTAPEWDEEEELLMLLAA